MTAFRVVVAAVPLPSERLDLEEAILGEVGAEVLDLRERPLASIRAELTGADAVLTEALGRERFDAALIATLERCRVISLYAVGTDGVDVAEATRRGIAVANVPAYCTPDVAEHTLALLLAAWRKVPRAERVARSGDWGLEELRPIRRLAGRTVGLLGLGRIAQEVAKRLAGFEVTLLAHDPYADPGRAARLGVRLCGLEELLRSSDVLSVHTPLTEETRGLLDREALALLPEGAVLVNAGRGGVIDEEALLEALRLGHLAAAALDVVATEPPDPGDPLLALDRVVCTPHMAYYSEDSLVDLRTSVARNAAAVLRGERPASLVNPAAWGDGGSPAVPA